MTLRAKAEAARAATTATWRPTTRWSHDDLEAFIAAASPDVVLGLLDRIEALQDELIDHVSHPITMPDGSGYHCALCRRVRPRDSDAPDGHEPTCLPRREGP